VPSQAGSLTQNIRESPGPPGDWPSGCDRPDRPKSVSPFETDIVRTAAQLLPHGSNGHQEKKTSHHIIDTPVRESRTTETAF
jgi:hypothetical protein